MDETEREKQIKLLHCMANKGSALQFHGSSSGKGMNTTRSLKSY